MPKLVLAAADGARAEVYLHGAHVTSWVPAGEVADRLFVSGSAEFSSSAAIRGGVPVIFPQFNVEGPLPKHGFARTQTWDFAGTTADPSGAASAVLRLTGSEATRAIWPHQFAADLTVAVGGPKIAMTLNIRNTGVSPFSFTAALHTYLRINDLRRIAVHGLQNLRFRDSASGGVAGVQAEPALAIEGEVDRIYFDAPAKIEVREAGRSTRVESVGFPDVVVWNPGATRGATISDLEPGGYARMLCVEAAAIGTPVRLDPGDHWRGSQTLIA